MEGPDESLDARGPAHPVSAQTLKRHKFGAVRGQIKGRGASDGDGDLAAHMAGLEVPHRVRTRSSG